MPIGGGYNWTLPLLQQINRQGDMMIQGHQLGQEAERNALQKQVEEMVRRLAEEQGMEKTKKGYQLTPKAYRIFQGKLLEQIFSQLQASRTGRHTGPPCSMKTPGRTSRPSPR